MDGFPVDMVEEDVGRSFPFPHNGSDRFFIAKC